MHITVIRPIAGEVKRSKPDCNANYTIATMLALRVAVETDQGLAGLGEAAHFGGPVHQPCKSFRTNCATA